MRRILKNSSSSIRVENVRMDRIRVKRNGFPLKLILFPGKREKKIMLLKTHTKGAGGANSGLCTIRGGGSTAREEETPSWRSRWKERQVPTHCSSCQEWPFSGSSIKGEGNGNPLQYSCLENPMDRGAWWAAVHRVAQSRTRLKQLSMPACIGEGNGNPLQCFCLENPRDGGACWAAVYGIAQLQTRLKQLSSSSSNQRQIMKTSFLPLPAPQEQIWGTQAENPNKPEAW